MSEKSEVTPYIHKVHYYETDQMGVVHHSNYIRWFEEARTHLLDEIGFGYKRIEDEGIISPVLSVSCEYKIPVKYGESVYIIPVIESFNGVKFTVSYRITDVVTGELRTVGTSNHCFLGKDFKPVNVKKSNPKLYEVLAGCVKQTK